MRFGKGAAKDLENTLFAVIRTSIEGCVIVNSEIKQGQHLFGGEFGFMPVTDKQVFSDLGTAVKMAVRCALRKNKKPASISGEEIF
ncbi:ROK family protein [Carnobacterium iners]|uniref:ROK family protein n=1 Tax=Carnobacterium iners TaxID=1073423 RepID=UPI0008D65F55|nr:ROK family protein [Carnobacterium iners]SEK60104.1 hypothetical protein SAMN04488114_1076 [Carnobacterium iners]